MSQNDTDVIDNLLFCATLIKGLEISMNAQRIFSLIAATLLTTPVWAENTAAGLSTTDDYVNATSDRAAESKSGERFLELFTSKSNTATVSLTYVGMPSISSGNIDLPETLKDSIVYMAGYLTCVSLGDTDTASGFLGVARKLANIVEPRTS